MAPTSGSRSRKQHTVASVLLSVAQCPILRVGHFIDKRRIWQWLAIGSLGWLALPLLPDRAIGAERVYVSYGPFERSISVAALENYAKTGEIDDDLAVYAQYVNPQQLVQLRRILQAPADISPITVSQFLYTPQGEILLKRLGSVIESEARQEGFYALRAAFILAASDPKGLSLLNVLQKFPTSGIRINLERSLEVARDLEQVISQNNRVTEVIVQAADEEIAFNPPFVPNPLVNLRAQGGIAWQKESFTLVDPSRGTPLLGLPERTFPVDLYLPQPQKQPAPVIVISHGLGSDRDTFRYLAQHLASHGFVVAVPEHPGSNATQLQALLNGAATEAAAPSEFVDRPLDIKYLLDELERRSKVDPALQGQLNLQQVGVIGQSFGGYTALVLGGAPINFPQLQKDCALQDTTLNLSLLLQCRALGLPPVERQLSDPRVKAIIALNPIDSSVLGKEGLSEIEIPTLILGGNADTVAPALPEQIQPFTWLTTPDRYLVLIERGTHFSVTDETDPDREPIQIPPQVVGPNPVLARRYVSTLSLAFFQTYLNDRTIYRPYLSAAYARSISQQPLALNLIRSLSPEQLTQTISETATERTDPSK